MRTISVIIPCYNEEENIEITYCNIKNVFKLLPEYNYEIIFSDNDSIDNSQKILRKLSSEDKNLKVILNNRNFGCDCSIYNAIISSNGDATIFLTCDGQEPAEMIIDFVREWEKGANVVWGQKTSSKESKLMFLLRSLYYELIKKFAECPQYSHVIGFGLYDKKVVDNLRTLNDPNPILRNIIPNLGYKPVLLPYKQNLRTKGKTSHNFLSLFDYALNSMIHTSKIPMKIMIFIGLFAGIFSFLIGCVYLFYKITHWYTFKAGIAPIIIILSLFTSIQILFLGLIGEYLLAVLDRVSFSKNVIEKERINF